MIPTDASIYIAKCQQAIRDAKESDLSACVALIECDAFDALPENDQQELLSQYIAKLVELGIGAFA